MPELQLKLIIFSFHSPIIFFVYAIFRVSSIALSVSLIGPVPSFDFPLAPTQGRLKVS
jgi:hypothetical protein